MARTICILTFSVLPICHLLWTARRWQKPIFYPRSFQTFNVGLLFIEPIMIKPNDNMCPPQEASVRLISTSVSATLAVVAPPVRTSRGTLSAPAQQAMEGDSVRSTSTSAPQTLVRIRGHVSTKWTDTTACATQGLVEVNAGVTSTNVTLIPVWMEGSVWMQPMATPAPVWLGSKVSLHVKSVLQNFNEKFMSIIN